MVEPLLDHPLNVSLTEPRVSEMPTHPLVQKVPKVGR
jgi:hypothetical protein